MSEREQPIKVAFVGTSCIGKTTLVDEYRQRFSGNSSYGAVVEEAARTFFTQNPDVTDRFSAEAQGQVQALALRSEQDAHNTGARVILCDRSVIDAVVYVRANGDREGADRLLKGVEFWLPTYHRFLLLDPADVPYQIDDVRQEDEQVRQGFHNAFLEFFQESGIPFELLSGTVEERITRVDQIINE